MKKITAIIALLLTCFSTQILATTVDIKDVQVPEPTFKGTISPIFKLDQFGNGVLTVVGGRLNAVIKNMFLVGIGAQGAVGQTDLMVNDRTEDISYFMGGIGAGFRLFPDRIFHLSQYNTLGLAYLNLHGRGQKAIAYVLEPEINAEIDVLSMCRIGAGLSYRLMTSPNIDVPSSKLFGLNGQIFVEFSWL